MASSLSTAPTTVINELSRYLSLVLRHKAREEGLAMTKDGYICVDDILRHRKWAGRITQADVRRAVETNDKQRFSLNTYTNNGKDELFIRANQGHTVKNIEVEMRRLTLQDLDEFPDVVHGTYASSIQSIKVSIVVSLSYILLKFFFCIL